ncbi:hypothetical protein HanRHA438_Chr02g0083241 [Helianthus annuus]|nr:hypothetical protein HanRHA438_Chr02g0083241 [Helianthus annuus]
MMSSRFRRCDPCPDGLHVFKPCFHSSLLLCRMNMFYLCRGCIFLYVPTFKTMMLW